MVLIVDLIKFIFSNVLRKDCFVLTPEALECGGGGWDGSMPAMGHA